MKLPAVIILLALILSSDCAFKFYSRDTHPKSFYQCLKPSLTTTLVLRLGYFLYQINEEMMTSAMNAVETGVKIQLILDPTRCREPEEQIDFILQIAKKFPVDRLWVGLMDQSRYKVCSWANYQPQENCQYLQRLFAEGKRRSLNLGMFYFQYYWMLAFKTRNACSQISSTPLWLFEYPPHKPAGGWLSYEMDLAAIPNICGQDLYAHQVVREAEMGK